MRLTFGIYTCPSQMLPCFWFAAFVKRPGPIAKNFADGLDYIISNLAILAVSLGGGKDSDGLRQVVDSRKILFSSLL